MLLNVITQDARNWQLLLVERSRHEISYVNTQFFCISRLTGNTLWKLTRTPISHGEAQGCVERDAIGCYRSNSEQPWGAASHNKTPQALPQHQTKHCHTHSLSTAVYASRGILIVNLRRLFGIVAE
jgi:hypothetical protein